MAYPTGVVVDQPAVGSLRYGLLSVANGPLELPAHGALSGLTYEAEHCGDGFLWPAAQCPPLDDEKDFDPGCALGIGVPYTVGATYQAGAIGHTEADLRRRALVRHRDNRQKLVEQEFWGGRTAAPVLTDVLNSSGLTITDLTGGTAVSIEDGLAALEEFLADYPYRGILHARPAVSVYATERLLSVPDGKPAGPNTRYVSPMGNFWSFGRGYSGNNPDTAVAPGAGEAYIVATGTVTNWAGPEQINPLYRSMDRTTNQVYALVEQPWATAIDCLIGYALVTLDGTT